MLSIKDLAADIRTVVVTYGTHEVTVLYKPSTLSSKFVERIGNEPLAVLLAEAIEEWDVVDDIGNPYKTTADLIGDLAISFQRRVFFDGILADNSLVGLPEAQEPSAAS